MRVRRGERAPGWTRALLVPPQHLLKRGHRNQLHIERREKFHHKTPPILRDSFEKYGSTYINVKASLPENKLEFRFRQSLALRSLSAARSARSARTTGWTKRASFGWAKNPDPLQSQRKSKETQSTSFVGSK